MRLLIVGFNQAGHMGSYLAAAANQLSLDFNIVDAQNAHASSRIARSFYWRFYDKRPARLHRFGAQVLDTCIATQRDVVLTTGCAPLDRECIERLRELGVKIINYSTDDPWNPSQRADWFLSALPAYDAVFTARRANMDDFRRHGIGAVHYLPFAYDPEIHRPWPRNVPAGAPSDILFVGGCDAERLSLIGALIDDGLDVEISHDSLGVRGRSGRRDAGVCAATRWRPRRGTDPGPETRASGHDAEANDAAAARPREPIGFRAFVSFDMVALAAADSFDAALGTSSMTAVGGGGEVLNLWKGLFARVGVSSMSDTGTRLAIVDDDIFDLEIPLDVKIRTIEFGGGWRYVRRARPRPAGAGLPLPPPPPPAKPAAPPPAKPGTQAKPGATAAKPAAPARPPIRFAAYGGGGLVRVEYRETSDFSSSLENVRESFSGYFVFGGVEVPIWKWIFAGAEAQYRSVPDALGDGGVSEHFGESDLGGTVLRVMIGIRKMKPQHVQCSRRMSTSCGWRSLKPRRLAGRAKCRWGPWSLPARTSSALGHNQPIGSHDPTAHAEIVALRAAAARVGNYRLTDATLYVTIEPCLMCVGALVHARVGTLVYGAPEPKAGAIESSQRAHEHPALNHRLVVVSGVLASECGDIVARFFKSRRG